MKKQFATILLVSLILGSFFNACSKKTTEAAQQTPPQRNEVPLKKYPSKDNDMLKREMSTEKASSQNYMYMYQIGYKKHNEGDYQGAIADFSRSIELNPQFAESFSFRGLSKYKSGDMRGACADWKKAVELQLTEAQKLIDEHCK